MVQLAKTIKVQVIRFQSSSCGFRGRISWSVVLESAHNGAGNFVVDCKHVFQCAIVKIRPAMVSSPRVDKLDLNSCAISDFLGRSLEHNLTVQRSTHVAVAFDV